MRAPAHGALDSTHEHTMKKKELVAAIREQMEQGDTVLNLTQTATLIDLVFAQLTEGIATSERMSYPDFGTFSVKSRKAREGRNPQTGAKIQIPASKTVGFKPAPALKDALN